MVKFSLHSCEFFRLPTYGVILPEGDRQWHNTINAFIARQAQQLEKKWLGEYFPKAVSDLDYCFHKQKN
jgi:hypothetical protein